MYILHKKIQLEIIEREFSESDLEYAIDEASDFFPDTKPQIERLTQNLLHFFIEHPPNKPYKYILSSHATRFIEFLGNKLFNEHKHFPLRKTFQRYGLFKAEKIKNITEFKTWFKFHFQNSSKTVIEDHLEAFRDLVDQSIIRLGRIVTSKDDVAVEGLEKFTKIFKESLERSEEIKETIQLSSGLKNEMRNVIEYFGNKIQEFPHTRKEKEEALFKELNDDFEEAIKINNEVTNFFEIIDQKLDKIIERYIYADKQLANFKENFRIRTQFQRNLRKFLEVSLESATYDRKKGVKFNKEFKLKSLPVESFKFLNVKKYDDFIKKQSFVIPQEIDADYAFEKSSSANKILSKQEEIARQVNIFKINLSKSKNTDITSLFYKLLDETKNEKMTLKIVYDILKYASKEKQFEILIKKEITEKYKDKNILIWQINILQRH